MRGNGVVTMREGREQRLFGEAVSKSHSQRGAVDGRFHVFPNGLHERKIVARRRAPLTEQRLDSAIALENNGLRNGTAPAREDAIGKGVGGSAKVAPRFAFRCGSSQETSWNGTRPGELLGKPVPSLYFSFAESLSGLHGTGSPRGRSRLSRFSLTGRPRTPVAIFA